MGKVTAAIAYTSGANKQYLKNAGVIVNLDDVSILTDDTSYPASRIEAFSLASGTTGYAITTTRRAWNYVDEQIENGEEEGWKHMLNNVIVDTSAVANVSQLDLMKDNSRYVFVLKDENGRFWLLGSQCGLKCTAKRRASNENNANFVCTFETEEGMIEEHSIRELLITDTDTTQTAFDNAFNNP